MFLKKIIMLVPFLYASVAFSCGCVDGYAATRAALAMNENYHEGDKKLAQALSALGETIRESYEIMNDGALDVERIARLKKEQAITLRSIVFENEKTLDLSILNNQMTVKSIEADLTRAEQTAVLKAMILNKKSPLEE